MMKLRIAPFTGLLLAVVALSNSVALGQRAAAQRASRFRGDPRPAYQASSRNSQQTSSAAAPKRVAKKEPTATNRQVSVEIVFVEVETPDAAKGKPVTFSGDVKDVERRLQELKSKRQIKTLQRIHLSALDGQSATSQQGGQVARVTSSQQFRRGGQPSRSYSYQSFGTLAKVTPRVAADGSVALELSLEKSWPKGGDKPSEPEESVQPPGTATVTLKNSARVQPGKYTTVSKVSIEADGSTRQTVVLVTVQVGEKRTEAKTRQVLKVFRLQFADARSITEVLNTLFADQSVTIAADANSNAVVAGSSDARILKSITEVLDSLDAPPKGK